jgi:transposase
MALVGRLSQREIRRRTGAGRDTSRKALRSSEPPSYGPRPKRASKLDPHLERICELLDDEPTLSGVRIAEEIAKDGYEGGESILNELLRELRPRFAPPRTFQRTNYRPGELVQFDLTELGAEVPVGRGQMRKGYVLTAKPLWSSPRPGPTSPGGCATA